MQYAIIMTGGKQYPVTLGAELEVELLHATGTVTFDQVLLVVDGDKVEVGTPTVKGTVVTATVVGDIKGDKLDILRYKSKSRYRKHTGHRQQYTKVRIDSIGDIKDEKPVVEKKTTAKKVVAKKSPAKKTPTKKTAEAASK